MKKSIIKKLNLVRIVTDVKPSVMNGANKLERYINAYLTKRFVLEHDVPSDECLTEAKYILKLIKKLKKKAGKK